MNVKLPNKDRFTIREVATLLDKNISTVWRWTMRSVRGRKLSRFYIGARAYILREDLDTFLNGTGASEDTAEAVSAEKSAARAKVGAELDAAGI